MCGSGVLTSTVTEIWRMARILKVHPQGINGYIAAAVGTTLQSTAPRPIGTTVPAHGTRTTLTASA